jgi:serine/threonine protein kinase
VAIKLLRQELCGDQKLLVRFFNEARAANAIAHPNIVEVLDVGVMEDGPPYIVMELLEGENLAARIAHSGRIELGEALEYVRQAAAALTVAHDLGIVHRDLKPDNIFLESSGAQRRRVKLLDFGIAKLTAALTSASVQTRAGAILGTPAYMSPEQCLGRSGEVDRRRRRARWFSEGGIKNASACFRSCPARSCDRLSGDPAAPGAGPGWRGRDPRAERPGGLRFREDPGGHRDPRSSLRRHSRAHLYLQSRTRSIDFASSSG